MKAADASLDPAAGVRARKDYARLQDALAATNLGASELERVLNLKQSKQQRIDALKGQHAGWTERAAAIDAYLTARSAVSAAGAGLESSADLKRLLRGSGVLEFHILPAQTDPGLQAGGGYEGWAQRLQKEGPRVRAGDQYRWFEVENPEEFKGQAVPFDDRMWVLASIKPADSLDRNSGEWKLARVYETASQLGQRVVGFEFDTNGAKLFGDLTRAHVN
jgi:preprotein translocase subunit SecD